VQPVCTFTKQLTIHHELTKSCMLSWQAPCLGRPATLWQQCPEKSHTCSTASAAACHHNCRVPKLRSLLPYAAHNLPADVNDHEAMLGMLHEATLSRLHEAMLNMLHEATLSMLHEATLSLLHEAMLSMLHEAKLSMFHEAKLSMLHETMLSVLHEAMLNVPGVKPCTRQCLAT